MQDIIIGGPENKGNINLTPLTIIKIIPHDNGGHENQTINEMLSVPEGWAVIPESLGTPETLKHYPFGEITVADVDGIPTVTGWTPLPVPEPETPEPETPEPGPETSPTLESRVETLEAETAAISAAIERGLSL